MTDYDKMDALAMAEAVRARKVSPAELLREAQARADKVNAKINAIVMRHDAEAQAQIDQGLPAGPFSGVPFLIKDLSLRLKGTITTGGSKFFKDDRAAADTTLVSRYKKAGLVIFGKTASPEFGLTATTESLLFGDTRNPWNPDRIAGGSSGGAAAAVAARILPLANASDGGGSIRTPASCCGVFGMKPTRGRVPMGPDKLEGWQGLSTVHAVSLSVRDNAALLDAVHGLEPGSPYAAPGPERPFLEEVARGMEPQTIALIKTAPNGMGYDGDVAKGIDETIRLLESLGHKVVDAAPEFDGKALAHAMVTTLAVSTLMTLEDRAKVLGRAVTPDDVETITWWFYQEGKSRTGEDYARAAETFRKAGRIMAEFRAQYPLALSPTQAKPPIPLGTINLSPADFSAYMREIVSFSPFTGIYNQTGEPAMTVPLHWTGDGLPVGMMFSAGLGQEGMLYRLAGQLEKASPWWDKKPPICA